MSIWKLKKILKIKSVIFIAFLTISCTTRESIVPDNESWTFVLYGDTRGGYDIMKRISYYIADVKPKPLAIVCVGDMITTPGSIPQWELFWQAAKPITYSNIPHYLVKGNHDANDSASTAIYNKQANLPNGMGYYAVTEKSVLFLILDTEIVGERASIRNEQLVWLKAQLAEAQNDSNITHIMPCMHRPLYPQGHHAGENLKNADELHQLFLDHPKTKVITAGHDHLYNKYVKDGIVYITTGGGGAQIHPELPGSFYHYIKVSFSRDNTLNFKVRGIFNEIVEEWNI